MMALLSIVSCGGKNTSEGEEETGGGYKSQAYKLVVSNIEEMAKKSWDKAAYIEIRDKQITVLKKNSEQLSAKALLDTEYGNLMARDAKSILEAGCCEKGCHKVLNALLAELKGYPNATGLGEVKELKALHDKAGSFASSAVGRQPVADYNTPYDKSYETKKMAEAQKWLDNPKLKCNDLRTRLEALTKKSAYASRRRAYCEAIVKSYLECTNSKNSELNATKANLKIYEGNLSAWIEQIENHNKELKEQKTKQ